MTADYCGLMVLQLLYMYTSIDTTINQQIWATVLSQLHSDSGYPNVHLRVCYYSQNHITVPCLCIIKWC